MSKRDFLSLADVTADELAGLLRLAAAVKRGDVTPSTAGKSLVLLLEKPSLRTRVSFELGMQQMGGMSLSLGQQEVGLGTREPVADAARVLSRYASVIAARVFDHRNLEELARHSSVPVINALSDVEHPCQALADLLTIKERFGDRRDLTVTFIGDGNNVAASLAIGSALQGWKFCIATPEGYELPRDSADRARRVAVTPGWSIEEYHDPRQAARGADVVYTDVWTSMGQEAEKAERERAFAGYQVNPDLMRRAHKTAIFLHDLPAHHGEEISDDMLDQPQSAVFDQAENRLHAQKALVAYLLGAANLMPQ